MTRVRIYILISAAIWFVALLGCDDIRTAANLPRNPDALADTSVYGPELSGGATYLVSVDRFGQDIGAMPAERSVPFAGFKAWKANDDPGAPFAGLRKALRDADK